MTTKHPRPNRMWRVVWRSELAIKDKKVALVIMDLVNHTKLAVPETGIHH